MNWIPEEIENYCFDASSQPHRICEEIFQYTKQNVPMSIMLIGPIEAAFLGFFLKSIRARRVLEIGCFTGYSALAMAEYLPDDGEIITLDLNPDTTRIAQSYWTRSPHGKKIRSMVGPALESLKGLTGPFDFVFIDADKENYPHYFEAALSKLGPRGVIALDNALREGNVLNENPDEGTKAIRDLTQKIHARSDLQTCLLPIRDGLLLVQRKD